MNGNNEQSLALIQILKDALKAKQEQFKMVCWLLVISIVVNILIVVAFLVYNYQYDYQTDTITTTTVEQEVDGNSSINNINGNQYRENSIHIQN